MRLNRKYRFRYKYLFLLFVLVLYPFVINAGNQTQTHDANGNLINDGEYCYTYNDANRLSVVKTCADNKLVAEYIYNFAGQRVVKKVYDKGVFQYQILTVKDLYEIKIYADGSQEETLYYRANGELIASKVIKRPAPSATPTSQELKYHHNDHLGSASLVTSSTGTKVEETTYLPYGEVRSGGSESLTGRYQFTDQEKDNETGLMYYGARYYNPKTGRFVQPDSVLPNIYDPQQLNRYAYVRNNPLKYVDPSGHYISKVVMSAIRYIAVHAGTDFAADVAVQTVFDYYFNSETDSWEEAFGNVDYIQAGRSGVEGLIPTKSMKARLIKAFATASGDVGMNAMKGNYSSEQAFQDFAIGVIGDLSGQGLNNIVAKYGISSVGKGLAKMGFGVDYIIGSLGKSNIASKIANGHAQQHMTELGVANKTELANMIKDIMSNPTATKISKNGQRLYWSEKNNAFLAVNPNDNRGDFGSIYYRKDRSYYDRQE